MSVFVPQSKGMKVKLSHIANGIRIIIFRDVLNFVPGCFKFCSAFLNLNVSVIRLVMLTLHFIVQ